MCKSINNKTFIIAEIGVNHNGSILNAKKLIDIAKEAGADAVKFQLFDVDNMTTQDAPLAGYQKQYISHNHSQYSMLHSLVLSASAQNELYIYCKEKNIVFLSSPFDIGSAQFLCHELDLSMIKIPSGEITNLPLLIKIAQWNKSVLLSTGMSTLSEVEIALSILAYGYLNKRKGYPHLSDCEKLYYSKDAQAILAKNVSILHCTSSYPAPHDEINLRTIPMLIKAFGLPVGYSDHTTGIAVAIAAVAMGASIIEKHITLDKKMQGPDHHASLDPIEFSTMIKGIRQVELALGSSKKIPTPSEMENRFLARKSIVAKKNIMPDEFFSDSNLACKRPAQGLSPLYFSEIYHKRANRAYIQDEIIEK